MNLKQNIVFLFIFISISSFSQFTLKGKVFDKNNNSIEFVNIILKDNDIILKGTISDTSGNFIINNINQGSYILCFSSIGYIDTCINIKLDSNIVYMCQLEFKINTIDEIAIVTNRPTIKIEGNKTVININKQILNNLETTENVLKFVPGMIKTKGGYQIFGKDKPLILVNGIPSTEFEINAIQPQNIIKIETFNNTGQYDASIQNVINIITLKKNYFGSQVYNGLRYSSPSFRNNFRLYLTVNKNKIQQSFFYKNSYGCNPWNESSINKIYNDSSILFSNEFILDASNFSNSNYLYYAINYSIDTLQNIGVKLNANYGLYKNNNNFNSYINNETYTNITDENSNNKNIQLSLNYDLQTKKEHFVSIIFDTYFDYSEIMKKINQTISIDTLNNSTNYKINSIVADYSIPVKKINSKFNFGGKLFQTINNNITSNFDYIEKNQLKEESYASYIAFSNHSFKKFSFEIGIRNEYYKRDINNLSYDSLLKFKENKLFPSFSVAYKLNTNLNFSLNYKKYIDRSAYSYVTNQYTYINPYLYKTSNPLLKPDVINSLFLNIMAYKSIQLSAGYKNHTNYTTMFFSNKDSIIIIGYNNTRKQEIFMSLSTSIQRGKTNTNISLNTTRPFFEYKFLNENKQINTINYSFSVNNIFSITENFASNVSLQYSPQSQFDLFLYKPMFNLSVGVKKFFFHKNLRISLYYNFNLEEEYNMQYNQIELLHKYSRDKNMLLFSLLYKLNFNDKWINNNNGIESELNRINQ